MRTEFITIIKNWCINGATPDELIALKTTIENCLGDDKIKLNALRLLQEKGKLHAVKYVKEVTGWSLIESKNYCDALTYNQ